MPTPKWKEKVAEINDRIDAKADAELEKIKESRFTWAILGGAALIIAAIIFLLATY